MTHQYPNWDDEQPCACCGDDDRRHRSIDAMLERLAAGEHAEDVAADYSLSTDFVQRLAADKLHQEIASRIAGLDLDAELSAQGLHFSVLDASGELRHSAPRAATISSKQGNPQEDHLDPGHADAPWDPLDDARVEHRMMRTDAGRIEVRAVYFTPDGSIAGWTPQPASLWGIDEEDLRGSIPAKLEALLHPCLLETELPGYEPFSSGDLKAPSEHEQAYREYYLASEEALELSETVGVTDEQWRASDERYSAAIKHCGQIEQLREAARTGQRAPSGRKVHPTEPRRHSRSDDRS